MKAWVRGFGRGVFASTVFGATLYLAVASGSLGGTGTSASGWIGLALATGIGMLLSQGLLGSGERSWVPRIAIVLLGLSPTIALNASWAELLRWSGLAWLDVASLAWLPMTAVVSLLDRASRRVGALLIGAVAAQLVFIWAGVPWLGWRGTMWAAAALWLLSEALGEPTAASETTRRGARRAAGGAAVAWFAFLGMTGCLARIGLLQQIPPGWWSVQLLPVAVLIGAGIGAMLGVAIERLFGRRWLIAAWILLPVALWSSARMFLAHEAAAPWAGLESEEIGVVALATATACWVLVGFPLVAWGLGLPLLAGAGRWLPALAASGLATGILVAEGLLVPRLDVRGERGVSWARRLVEQPALGTVEAVRAHPAGLSSQVRERAWLEFNSRRQWRGMPCQRDAVWAPLEEIEVRLPRLARPEEAGVGVFGVRSAAHWRALGEETGEVVHLDPVPVPERIEFLGEGGDRWYGSPWRERVDHWIFLAPGGTWSASSLDRTGDALAGWAGELVERGGSAWIWHDPRTSTASGVRSLLDTWRRYLPRETLWVLQAGLAGPLLGLQIGGREVPAESFSDRVVLRGEVAAIVAATAGPEATWNRPVSEWTSVLRVPGTPHPRAETLKSLREALAPGLGPGARELLAGLAAHAAVQIDRAMVQNALDRVTLSAESLEHYRRGLEQEPRHDALLRLAERVGRFLLDKKEYELLVPWLEDLVALRSDVAELHALLGRAYGEILDPEGAAAELSLALALVEPGSDEAFALEVELAKALADAGRWREAVTQLEDAWSKRTDLRVAKGLGLAYLELGQYEEARSFLSFVREEAPGDEEVQEAWERLEKELDR